MRNRRLFLISALAALAVLGAAGSGSASAATSICPTNTSPCGAGAYPLGTVFTANGSAFFNGTFSCSSTIKFETLALSGTPLSTKLTSFSLTPCTAGCVATVKTLFYKFNLEVTGTGPSGTGKILNGSSGDPEIEVSGSGTNCAGQVGCRYRGASLPEFITGGTLAILKSSGGVLPHVAGSGSGCLASLEPSMVHETVASVKGGFWVTT